MRTLKPRWYTSTVVRRTDGAHLSHAVSPYPIALYGIVARSMWEHSIQLCRYVKDKTLWACLAVMALAEKELRCVCVYVRNGARREGAQVRRE